MPNIPDDGPKPEEELKRLFNELMAENDYLDSDNIKLIGINALDKGGIKVEISIDTINMADHGELILNALNIENLQYFANRNFDAKNSKLTIIYGIPVPISVKNPSADWIDESYGD